MHFVLSGVVISATCKTLAEKYFMKSEKDSTHSIEPMYAFDIHCNAFFPLLIINYLI
jgi:hypothetical protein